MVIQQFQNLRRLNFAWRVKWCYIFGACKNNLLNTKSRRISRFFPVHRQCICHVIYHVCVQTLFDWMTILKQGIFLEEFYDIACTSALCYHNLNNLMKVIYAQCRSWSECEELKLFRNANFYIIPFTGSNLIDAFLPNNQIFKAISDLLLWQTLAFKQKMVDIYLMT